MQTIFKTGACLIPTCHTPDWIYSLYTISTSLGLPYLHNTHSTLGRVRSCPQTAQTDIRLQHTPAPQEVYFRSIPTYGPSRTNQPRTIQGWRRLPLRRPTRFRGQLRTVDYDRSSCGPGQVTSLLEL